MIYLIALPLLALVCTVAIVILCFAIAKMGNDGRY